MKTPVEEEITALECPYCGHDDMTSPLARIGIHMIEWICNRCGLTWNVADE